MGCVFDIQRFCVHDGPGLRTTVFLKGCPLRCRWCSNPESQKFEPELFYNRSRCMRCGSCVRGCPESAIERNGKEIAVRREKCVGCGKCEDVCPTGAVVLKGRFMSADDILRESIKDDSFYRTSGGGVTFSGGEPFAQGDFLRESLAACKSAGIATAVETSACADWECIEPCLPLLDHILVDVKHTDSSKHREWTGVGTEIIVENIRRILRFHAGGVLRIPVVPGFNADDAACAGFADFLGELEADVELLPYHVLGEGKYAMLDRDYPGKEIGIAGISIDMERLRLFLSEQGIKVSVDV